MGVVNQEVGTGLRKGVPSWSLTWVGEDLGEARGQELDWATGGGSVWSRSLACTGGGRVTFVSGRPGFIARAAFLRYSHAFLSPSSPALRISLAALAGGLAGSVGRPVASRTTTLPGSKRGFLSSAWATAAWLQSTASASSSPARRWIKIDQWPFLRLLPYGASYPFSAPLSVRCTSGIMWGTEATQTMSLAT